MVLSWVMRPLAFMTVRRLVVGGARLDEELVWHWMGWLAVGFDGAALI